MFDYQQELRRRIGQFRDHIAAMNHRAHEIAHGPCFMIFEEREPKGCGAAPPQTGHEESVQRLFQTFTELGLLEVADTTWQPDLPEEGWREGPTADRFVQFSFERDCFHLDMPIHTLTREEGEQIVRYRWIDSSPATQR